MDRQSPVRHETEMPSRTGPRSPLGAAICQLLDALDHAALIFDTRGRLLHETRAYRALVARESDSLALRRAVRELAVAYAASTAAVDAAAGPVTSLRRQARVPAPRRAPRPAPNTKVVEERFTLRRLPVTVARTLGGTTAEVVVVVVESRPLETEQALRSRYGLTPRELTVAHLITDGLSAPRIASVLGVSVHTVRRHSERIFRKLGVKTRAAVAARVLAAATDRRQSAENVDQSTRAAEE